VELEPRGGATPIEQGEAPGRLLRQWARLAESPWVRWAVLGGSPLVGLAMVLAIGAFLLRPTVPAAGPTDQEAAQPPAVEPAATVQEEPRADPAPGRLDPRWLPARTRLVLSVRASRLLAQPQASGLLGELSAWWEPSAGAVLRGLGLRPEQVQRFTWASTDLTGWDTHGVAIIELEAPQSAATLLPDGRPVDLGAEGFTFRQVPQGVWPHPFAAVDEHTILTGREDLLRELAQRGEARLESQPLARLLRVVASESDGVLLVDLSAARAARWKLPGALLDVWPAGKRPWRLLWEIPEGLGCTVQWTGSPRSELALACAGETAAEKVRSALDELIPAARSALRGQVESLPASLREGRLRAETAEQYKSLLDDGVAALDAARCDASDAIVWVRLSWKRPPAAVAATAIESWPAVCAEWLRAAQAVDEENREPLTAGLVDHAKPEAASPAAAAGSDPMPPEAKPPAEVKTKSPAEAKAKPPAEAKAKAEVEVRARLAVRIPQIDLPQMPLADAVALLAGMGNVPVSFDPDAMQELGVTSRDPVSVSLSNKTVGVALGTIVASRKLACVLDGGQVLVTSPAEHRQSLNAVRYPVEDLTGKDLRAAGGLARLVETLVAPESWQASGGRGTIRAEEGVLVVNQSGSVHYQVLVFCEKLRTARGLPARSPLSRTNPGLFTLATRAQRAAGVLGHPLTANFRQPAPLPEILAQLRQSSGAEIFVDGSALAAAGTSENVQATLQVQQQPLAAALDQLLAPLGLGWRAVAPDAVQVTTREIVAARLELEFYRTGSLLAKEPAAAVIERLKGRVPEATWSEGGGAGVVLFDAPSQCLLVLQTQPVQIALEAALRDMAK
jgi:hypothetical protein